MKNKDTYKINIDPFGFYCIGNSSWLLLCCSSPKADIHATNTGDSFQI